MAGQNRMFGTAWSIMYGYGLTKQKLRKQSW